MCRGLEARKPLPTRNRHIIISNYRLFVTERLYRGKQGRLPGRPEAEDYADAGGEAEGQDHRHGVLFQGPGRVVAGAEPIQAGLHGCSGSPHGFQSPRTGKGPGGEKSTLVSKITMWMKDLSLIS